MLYVFDRVLAFRPRGPDARALTSRPSATRFASWLEENHPGPRPTGGDQAQFEFEREWQRSMHEAGWAGISWPKEYGGRGASLIEQSIFGEELARAKAPRPANVLGLVMGGPVVIAHGTGGAEGALPRADPLGGGDLVPGLLGARVGLRPRLAQDQGGEGERRLADHRPEGLDDVRPRGEVVHARRPHRPGRAQAQGPHLLPLRHGAGRGRGPAAAPDHRRGRVQRALHRERLRPGRERGRRESATAGWSRSRR